MKSMNHVALVMAVTAVLILIFTPAASAQALDGKWFKINCNCVTKAVNPTTGEFSDFNFSFNAYVHFAYKGTGPAPRGANYTLEFWSQISPGIWIMNWSVSKTTSAFSENFFPDTETFLATKGGITIISYMTPHAVPQPGGFQAGGEILGGTDSRGRSLYGWMTVKGTPVIALPFKPL